MKKVFYVIGYIVGALATICAFSALYGAIIMWLWNWLAVSLFGASPISFGVACGIFVALHLIARCFGNEINANKN